MSDRYSARYCSALWRELKSCAIPAFCSSCHSGLSRQARTACDGSFLVIALNFTPVPRREYRIGVPRAGIYQELFNSDSRHYGGSDLGNASTTSATAEPYMGLPASLVLTLPPLAGLILGPV